MVLNILSIVISIISLIACCLSWKKIKDLFDWINELDCDITKYQTHTDGAFRGAWFDMKKLENKLNSHCHAYEFNDNILYIKEPIIQEDEEVGEDM